MSGTPSPTREDEYIPRGEWSEKQTFFCGMSRTVPQKHSRLASLGAVAILLVSSPKLVCLHLPPAAAHSFASEAPKTKHIIRDGVRQSS